MGNCLPVLEKDAASKETNRLLAQLVESQKDARKKQEKLEAKLQQTLEQMCESDTESEVDNLSSTTDASSMKAHKGSKKQRGRKPHQDLYLINKVAQGLDEVAKSLKPLPGMQD